ncbi:protein FAR1-RELATED SEQUENCE 1-like [Arachis stenosperma]|uniref:protein FAR1-RELATED SEQUENCE 1-like n=1 Tax=Arachis stenosperma TaxID=217475 RepID=UPI0025AB80A1|nr:protein FAR1-RELATED SEQUENCE 1-like [Arachis stenosperma]
MWVPIFFKGQFWASIRSTQRSEGMHSFFDGYLNCKTSLVQFVHEFDNVLRTKEQKELEDDATDSRGLIPCSTRSAIERRFQKEYTNEMFKDVQTEFGKKADCTICAVDEQGNSARIKMEEKILVYETNRYVTFDVHFDRSTHEVRCNCNLFESAVNEVPSCYVLPRWSKNIKRKHTYIKSSHDVRRSNESHNIFRELCAHFYNVAQEFVDCDNEADMLHNVLEDARAKLEDYRGKMRNNTVATAHNSIIIGSSIVFGTEDIQALSKVTIKGRPKGTRLGYELDKSIRKSMQRKRKSVRKEFVDCDNEADMLHNVLEDARAKLVDYRGKMRNNTVATAHNSIIIGSSIVFGTEDIQALSKVTTKGRPKGKRLGYELDKSIRKSMQRKRKSVRKVCIGIKVKLHFYNGFYYVDSGLVLIELVYFKIIV